MNPEVKIIAMLQGAVDGKKWPVFLFEKITDSYDMETFREYRDAAVKQFVTRILRERYGYNPWKGSNYYHYQFDAEITNLYDLDDFLKMFKDKGRTF